MNTKIIIGLLAVVVSLTSCKKWLDVEPESEISAPVLFSTENGFMEALTGIYTRCAQTDLYGKEMTFGTPEVLAQNYTMGFNEGLNYSQTSQYNYNNSDFIDRKDKIWAALYNGIVNANLILENVDKNKNVFSGNNYAIVKGEALALRAYLHFDALRLFAPAYIRGASNKGIPYVMAYTKDVTPMSTVGEAIDKAIADLEEAKQLLAADPIRNATYLINYPRVVDEDTNTEETSPFQFLQNRRHRLNYYAVCGTLARVYLYKNDQPMALQNALEVINAKKFPWTLKTDFNAFEESKKDRILYKELVFGWYMPRSWYVEGSTEDIKENWFVSGTRGLHLSEDAARNIYETGAAGANDLRFKNWLSLTGSITAKTYDIVKYNRNSQNDAESANLHYLMAPAIRLSEMYYIAAECTYPTDASKALEYINAVRFQRDVDNLTGVNSQEEFMRELIKECRKEWLAEGQLFYMYKRLNRSITGQTGSTIPASDRIFVLPLPNDEIVYGGR
ncbi:RagB/SusD family nutrient uptake outer membrane protein [Pedobacter faecalis]|uniref:RagB/SusD family nutrient uptake outer membrane protein n=1 Tax=Pedobacter faecalis TaxID=3041495 RepID=UPI00254F8EDC|nr:RagB/SusD family nutrient uptake outer membrane protein [Pedobacter sp. ELA7]